jgi:uncharacterized 2Fe-2S/4Fe-4S cluster protein (DUF4445 family)
MAPINYGNQTLKSVSNKTLFEYADVLNIRVPTSCGRHGKCHECIVEVKKGDSFLNNPTPEEAFLTEGYRLACQASIRDINGDVEFNVLRRQPKILTDSTKRKIELDSLTTRHGENVYYDGKILDKYRGAILGLAIDLGTTTVVMNLLDLETGEVKHITSFENPQKFGGSDVMNRISYDTSKYSGELKKVMMSSINFEIGQMSRIMKFHRRCIYEIVVVGNATMRDIFFGLDVSTIGEKPYKSKVEIEFDANIVDSTALNAKAKQIGLRIFPDANVYGGPLIGCHVGSDVAADLLTVGMGRDEQISMLVDVGTNTEVVVGNKNRMIAASCPAGPAFEGGEIAFGMPAYDGAIEQIKFIGDNIEYKTISGVAPIGICGSGLIDLLAELKTSGKMNYLGVLEDGLKEFMVVPENKLALSRSDISALAQAKAANYCGQKIVLREYGIVPNDVSNMYLAGGFGNYIDVENATRIGFIANVKQENIHRVGNAAIEGATQMLLSASMRNSIENICKDIEHIELETTEDFFNLFVDGCQFNPMVM